MITFTEDQIKIIKDNFERKGAAHQRDKLVEELSELLCEVCKHRVKGNRLNQISEEFADVCVVLKGFGFDVIFSDDEENIIRDLSNYIEKAEYQSIRGAKVGIEYKKLLDFTIVQRNIDEKVARLAKKQNYQVEPYEIIK